MVSMAGMTIWIHTDRSQQTTSSSTLSGHDLKKKSASAVSAFHLSEISPTGDKQGEREAASYAVL